MKSHSGAFRAVLELRKTYRMKHFQTLKEDEPKEKESICKYIVCAKKINKQNLIPIHHHASGWPIIAEIKLNSKITKQTN